MSLEQNMNRDDTIIRLSEFVKIENGILHSTVDPVQSTTDGVPSVILKQLRERPSKVFLVSDASKTDKTVD